MDLLDFMDDEVNWGRRIRRLLVAVVVGVSVAVDYHGEPDQYFSYFTVLTNLFIGLWALGAAILGKRLDRKPALRLSLTVYGLVTLVVYWVFLSPSHHPQGLNFWANLGLHLVVPVAMGAEGFLVPWPKATWSAPLWSLGFPLVYGVYILIWGKFTGWFPYFFLDPGQMGGWGNLGLVLGGLLLFFVGLSYFWEYVVEWRLRKVTDL